jgi:hypothetical protein
MSILGGFNMKSTARELRRLARIRTAEHRRAQKRESAAAQRERKHTNRMGVNGVLAFCELTREQVQVAAARLQRLSAGNGTTQKQHEKNTTTGSHSRPYRAAGA